MSDVRSTPLDRAPRPGEQVPLALRLAMLAASMETVMHDTGCAPFFNGTPPMRDQIAWIREAVNELERLNATQSEIRDSEPKWPTKEEVAAYRDLFRIELDKNMNNHSGSPSTDAHQVALCAFVKARHAQR